MIRLLFCMMLCAPVLLQAQNVTEANVYPTNLEENMYMGAYDAGSATISGIYFLVLCDGDNSEDVTPPFEVSLYLYPDGGGSDIQVVKTYSLDGIHHMGSHEFKDETVDFSELGLSEGSYRLGVWVNSNKAFSEDASDNAMLFKGTIVIGQSQTFNTSDGW